eukprot:gene3775-13841_t
MAKSGLTCLTAGPSLYCSPLIGPTVVYGASVTRLWLTRLRPPVVTASATGGYGFGHRWLRLRPPVVTASATGGYGFATGGYGCLARSAPPVAIRLFPSATPRGGYGFDCIWPVRYAVGVYAVSSAYSGGYGFATGGLLQSFGAPGGAYGSRPHRSATASSTERLTPGVAVLTSDLISLLFESDIRQRPNAPTLQRPNANAPTPTPQCQRPNANTPTPQRQRPNANALTPQRSNAPTLQRPNAPMPQRFQCPNAPTPQSQRPNANPPTPMPQRQCPNANAPTPKPQMSPMNRTRNEAEKIEKERSALDGAVSSVQSPAGCLGARKHTVSISNSTSTFGGLLTGGGHGTRRTPLWRLQSGGSDHLFLGGSDPGGLELEGENGPSASTPGGQGVAEGQAHEEGAAPSASMPVGQGVAEGQAHVEGAVPSASSPEGQGVAEGQAHVERAAPSTSTPVKYMSQQGILAWLGFGKEGQAKSRSGQASMEKLRINIWMQGRLVAHVWDDAVYDPNTGAMVAHVMRGGSLGILSAHAFDTSSPTIKLLCRLYRANIASSTAWLFPPRSPHHDGGNYYFEWGGYRRQGQYGWHDPSLYIFLAAFHSVDLEARRASQPGGAAVANLNGAGWRFKMAKAPKLSSTGAPSKQEKHAKATTKTYSGIGVGTMFFIVSIPLLAIAVYYFVNLGSSDASLAMATPTEKETVVGDTTYHPSFGLYPKDCRWREASLHLALKDGPFRENLQEQRLSVTTLTASSTTCSTTMDDGASNGLKHAS